nr:bacterial Ig-like domain-containing protein [Pseudoflavonifractor phocaeensis]
MTAGEDGAYTLLLNKTYDYIVTPTAEQVEGAQGSISLSESKIETVSLKTVTGIAVKTQPGKTDYYVGDALDAAGLVVTVSYSDGSTREISQGFDVSGFDSWAAGAKTVMVTYCGSSTTFPVTVSEKPFPSAVFNALAGKAQVAYTHNDKYQGEPGQEFVEEDGVLRSNSKGQSSSQVTVTITIDESVAQGSLSFWYKVSSEGSSYSASDGLSINGDSKIGGEEDWTKHTLDVKGGDTVTLSYIKDYSLDKGNDCVYLKDFTLETLHTATFTLSPGNAQMILKAQNGEETIEPVSNSNGTVVYALADGTYDYTVSCFGYAERTGQIVVDGADVKQTVTLDTSAQQAVTFQVTRPEDISAPYTISVLFHGEPVTHSGDDADVYQLPAGEYTYTVSCEGCEPASGSFTVGADAVIVLVTLERQWTLSDYFKAISPAITAENGTRYGFVRDTEQDGGLISDNAGKSSSSATMTLTFSQAARLDFAYRVSSEEKYDKFTLKHGTDTLITASGNGEWTEFAVSVAAGDSLTFQYEKDSGGNEGSDAVRLKNFCVTALYPLTCAGLPEGGTFAVRDSKGQTIASQSDGTYLLPEGVYTYTASAFGYETAQGSFSIPDQSSVIVSLNKLSTYKVTFRIPEGASLTVTHPTAGSMDAFRQGDAFTLPAGETYSYEITKTNCLPSRGSFTLTEERTIEVGALTDAGEGWPGLPSRRRRMPALRAS